jgi:hypothetical protein
VPLLEVYPYADFVEAREATVGPEWAAASG